VSHVSDVPQPILTAFGKETGVIGREALLKGKAGLAMAPADDHLEVAFRQMGLVGDTLRSMNMLAGRVARGGGAETPLLTMRRGGTAGAAASRTMDAVRWAHRNINLPLAHSQLWFLTYGVGNVAETYLLGALNGVPSMPMNSKNYKFIQHL
jgi:hypothetical protein